jgi:hypothetical protein
MDRITLYDLLSSYIDESDFKKIIFRLGIRYENIAGDALEDKVMSLIERLEDLHRLPEMITVLQHVRPDIKECAAPEDARKVRQKTQYETWRLDMDDLMKELPKRLGSRLVGLGISFDDINFENGSDLVLQNFCLRARNEYGWNTSGPQIRTLNPLTEQITRRDIIREVRRLKTGYVFYNLKVKFTAQEEANTFWQELQNAFDTEFQRVFGTDQACSMIVVMAGGPQTVFPKAISYLGQFAIQRDHVFEWVFRVINDMANRTSVHYWPHDISHAWTDLAISDSKINNSISLYDLFNFLSQSIRLLTECQAGHDFLQSLREL